MTNLQNTNIFRVIGTMSGTSLDGLDIAYCIFNVHENSIQFEIVEAETVPYTSGWLHTIKQLHEGTAKQLAFTDRALGKWMGQKVSEFLNKHNLDGPLLVASHGHTIFHDPLYGYTFQAGNGASIAAACKLPVVCDFRSLDVALSGQGAPLVPLGDQELFSEYRFCLNLGGIANVSFKVDNQRRAFDIVPVNMALNDLARKEGFEFDFNGTMAASGVVSQMLLNELDGLDFYVKPGPKSLGYEWYAATFKPVIEKYRLSNRDVMATLVAHGTSQIAKSIRAQVNVNESYQVLVTGGGAFNSFFVQELQHKLEPLGKVIIPDEKTVKFKEALIFALLGLYRWLEKENCLRSVTGAVANNIGGCIYLN